MARVTVDNYDQLAQLFVIDQMITKLMAEYGLTGWRLVWDRSKQRGGQCRYAKRELGFSAYLFSIWTLEQCINIAKHEIAHALTPGHGHDKVWQAKHKEIGGNGKRCWGSDNEARIQGRWIGECPNGHQIHRQRKSKAMNPDIRRSCGLCSPTFDARYLITWKENI